MTLSERGRKRLLESIQKDAVAEIAELDSPPHGEEQPIIDRLEGAIDPFGDFAQGDGYDSPDEPFDWDDE